MRGYRARAGWVRSCRHGEVALQARDGAAAVQAAKKDNRGAGGVGFDACSAASVSRGETRARGNVKLELLIRRMPRRPRRRPNGRSFRCHLAEAEDKVEE